jgi:hypothetical protein
VPWRRSGCTPRTTEQRAHLIGVDLTIFNHRGLAGGDLPRDFPRDGADLPLELADARLARVLADDRRDRVVGERDVLAGEPRLLDLARDEVFLGDLRLFLFRVARELHDFHAVEKRTRNVLEEVRRRDEETPSTNGTPR